MRSLEDEINNADAETSPETFKEVSVPRDVTVGCAAVLSLPPRFVALTVVALVKFPPFIKIVPSVNLEPVNSMKLALVAKIPLEAVTSPVTVKIEPSKRRLASPLIPSSSRLVITRLFPGLVYSLINPVPPSGTEDVKTTCPDESRAR